MLDCFYWFISVLQCHKRRCALFPFQGFFVGATSLVLQQQVSQILQFLQCYNLTASVVQVYHLPICISTMSKWESALSDLTL